MRVVARNDDGLLRNPGTYQTFARRRLLWHFTASCGTFTYQELTIPAPKAPLDPFQCILFGIFNYIETLETIYGIPREKINYIHGRRNSKDELIVGHNNDLDGRDYLSEEPMIYEYRAYDVIAEVINDERKRVSDILNYNHQYWTTLRDVNKVVVYGHSLSGVDLPFFLKIKECIQPNAEWHFSIHFENSIQKDSELNKINNFIAEIGLNKANFHTFNF